MNLYKFKKIYILNIASIKTVVIFLHGQINGERYFNKNCGCGPKQKKCVYMLCYHLDRKFPN